MTSISDVTLNYGLELMNLTLSPTYVALGTPDLRVLQELFTERETDTVNMQIYEYDLAQI